MARIFLSYRREDGIAQSGRIYDRLVGTYGEAEVFMDLGKISAGVDFTQVLDERLAACEIFIAVIGPRWLISRKGRRRLEDPEDFVRQEISTALQRDVRIIPVLIGDARMPDAAELPVDLSGLARRNAVKIREERFDADMDSLLLDIEEPDRPPEDTLLKRMQQLRERVRHQKNALLIGALVVALSAMASWTDLLDLFALDTRLSTLALSLADWHDMPPGSDDVMIAGIDAATETALGTPFGREWRLHHARVVDHLRRAGARGVAFDMYFEEPGPHDAGFIDALRRARDAGLSVYVGSRGAPSIEGLESAVTGVGLLCVGHRLGYATTAPLWTAQRDESGGAVAWRSPRYGLGLLAALSPEPGSVPDRTERALLVPTGDRVREIDIGAMSQIRSPQNVCPVLAMGEESAELVIRLSDVDYWRSPTRYLKYESLAGVSSVEDLSEQDRHLRGKTVLIGVAGEGVTADRHAVWHRFARQSRHGVELHADVIRNLRLERQIHPLHWGGQLLISAIMVTVAAALRMAIGGRSIYLSWGALTAAVLGYLWFAGYLCASQQVMINGAYHLAGLGLAYWLVGRLRVGTAAARETSIGGGA